MTGSDAHLHAAAEPVDLFDEHAAGLHRYLARRIGEEAAADVVVETFASPAATDDRPLLFGIATTLLGRRQEVHDPEDPLSVRLSALPAGQRDALLLAAWGRLDPQEIAAALTVPLDTARSLLRRAREALPDTGELAVLRSDIRSDGPTLAALRERVGEQVRERAPVLDSAPEPDPAPAPPSRSRIRWQPVAGVVALLAVLVGALTAAGGQEPVAPQPASSVLASSAPETPTTTEWQAVPYSASSSGWTTEPVTELFRLPRATDPPAGAVADLDLTMRDPAVRPGQYLYRRVEQAGFVTELWIPADVGSEWLMRQGGSGADQIEERATYGDFTTLLAYNTISVSDLAPDPRRNHTLLRVAAGVSSDPSGAALATVLGTLTYQPVPAGLRDDLIGALGYVPDLQVSTEDGGRTAVISADRTAAGQGRTDLLLDVATGMVLGDRYVDELGTYSSTVTTAVADEIGVAPGESS